MAAYSTDLSSCVDDGIGRQLLTAVSNNMPVATVEELLAQFTHPDQVVDTDGNTALMLAAKNANLALVNLLVSHGASVNQTDPTRHRTALMCAIKTGNKDIVERLLMAAPHSDDKYDETAAIDVDIGKQDVDGNSALMLAARHGHCSVVEVLLDAARRCRRLPSDYVQAEVDRRLSFVDIRNKHGQTALHEAAKGGHAAITAALVFAGASVDCADRWLNRPLQYATLHGHTAVVALLAAQRCDVNAPNLGRRTALHTAAQNGHSDIAAILLEAGACTTIRDSERDTPTLLAGRYQHRSVFEQLVAASSVPDVFNHSDSLGKNAFHYAAANGYIELVIGILQKFGAHQLQPSSLLTNDAPEIDYSRAPDWMDMKGNTALMLAVRRNHVEVVRILLQYNCSAHRLWQGPGGLSYSLFSVALRHGYVDILPLLADVGAVVRCSPYSGDISADILANDDVTAWLSVITSQPQALQQLCRQRIRQLLTCNIHSEVNSLPLPVTLQQYIVRTL